MSLQKAENPQTLKEIMFGPYADYVRKELKNLMKMLDIVDDFQRRHMLIDIQNHQAMIEYRINLLTAQFAVFSDPDILREYIDHRLPLPGVDQRLPLSGVDQRLPLSGVDQRLPLSGVDQRLPLSGVDQRLPLSGGRPKVTPFRG